MVEDKTEEVNEKEIYEKDRNNSSVEATGRL